MSQFHLRGLALGAWTLLLWSTRINNVRNDAALEGWSYTWQLGVSILFVAVGVVLIASSLLRNDPTGRIVSDRLGIGLAVFGSLWWLVRGTGTLIADHGVGFKMVHTLLALGTIAISGWFLSEYRGAGRSSHSANRELV